MGRLVLVRGCLLLALLSGAQVRGGDLQESSLRQVENFSLQDYRGQRHELADFADRQVVVVAVLGVECPLAKLYAPRLAKLEADYRDRGVGFLAIDANVQDSITEIAAYASRHGIEFPILKDTGNKVADALKAERTPQVFVLDADRKIRYQGRIDDQFAVGALREAPERDYLKSAMDELLAGQEVKVPLTQPVGCQIGRVLEPKPDARVTYAKQVSRILQANCVECHREGQIAPFALTDHAEVAGWAPMIREVVSERRMPPWHADPQHGTFANDRSMSEQDRELIYCWVDDGAPLGDIADLPEPAKFLTGWQLPREPDLVVTINPEPFEVKAQGEVRYQWFTVDPGLKEDKWLAGAEIVPGNRAVVHHILAFVKEPGEKRRFTEGEGFLVSYVPGLRAEPFPAGMAKFIPKGSELVFQVHYTPVGSTQYDQSKMGLLFTEPANLTHRVQTTQAINVAFEIPAQASNHEVLATSVRAPDDLLLSMMPHMHVRGKAFKYEAEYPDGTTEVLLDVPKYDFNWQTAYRLAEPKLLPKGTRVKCVAHYDNSEDNLYNPDPNKTVRWGDQTWEEMMIGYFDIAWPMSGDTAEGAGNVAEAAADPQANAESVIGMLDKDGDGKLARNEVPRRLLLIFFAIDKDRDGVITQDELAQSIEAQREREAERADKRRQERGQSGRSTGPS